MTESPNPEELREEVERTREQLADTVDELAAKFDVKSRVKESAHDYTQSAKESLTGPDGRPRPEIASLVGGIVSLALAFLVLRSLRRND